MLEGKQIYTISKQLENSEVLRLPEHALASSGVVRICCKEGQSWKLGHGALTVDFRARCSRCSMTNSFVTNAAPIVRAELLTSAPPDLADYTIFG